MRNNPTAGDRDLAASELRSSQEPLVQPESAWADDDEHRRWLVQYQRTEIQHLAARAEELEQLLRRRTTMLWAALVLCGLGIVTAGGMAVVQLTSAPQVEGMPAAVSSPEPRTDPSGTADQTRDEAEQLARQVEALTASRADLERQLAETGRDRGEAAQEVSSRDQRIAALERSLGEAERQREQQAAELQRLASDLRAANEAQGRLEREAGTRAELLEQKERELRASAGQSAALERELGQARQQLTAAQQQSEERRAVLEQQLASVTQSRDQATAALAARDQRVTALELELARAREAAARSEAEAQRLSAKPEELRLGAPELPSGDAPGSWRKTVLEGDIFIVPGSDQLAARASAPLQHAAALIRQTAGPVRIIGHMDTTGDADANQQLSLRRARAVRDYLISACGCDPARFEIDGRGSAEPVETNDTPAGRRANRRVELLIAN